VVVNCLKVRGSEEIPEELRMLECGQNKLQKRDKVFGVERNAMILTIG
jgi:hypothetical protein